MIEATLPKVRWLVSRDGPPGLKKCPGRNDPAYGVWMIENLIPQEHRRTAIIVDPMCGGGQLWALRSPGVTVVGCEKEPSRVAIAQLNRIAAYHGDARTWAPVRASFGDNGPDLVAFSFPYPNCDHNSANVKNDVVAQKGLQSMQDIGPRPDPFRTFTQIATYRGNAPVAVIAKNYIEQQVEVDDVGLLVQSGVMAGLGRPEVYRFHIGYGVTEQWKVKRGEFSAKTGRTHRAVEHEYVIVFWRD